MGAALAAVAAVRGHRVYWASTGRSPATRARAERAGLAELPSLAALCDSCALVIGICPPHGAAELAREVAARGFKGIYVDANAISPGHAREVGAIIRAGGGSFVDGAIIGPP